MRIFTTAIMALALMWGLSISAARAFDAYGGTPAVEVAGYASIHRIRFD